LQGGLELAEIPKKHILKSTKDKAQKNV